LAFGQSFRVVAQRHSGVALLETRLRARSATRQRIPSDGRRAGRDLIRGTLTSDLPGGENDFRIRNRCAAALNPIAAPRYE
jgi:hypothetical protein